MKTVVALHSMHWKANKLDLFNSAFNADTTFLVVKWMASSQWMGQCIGTTTLQRTTSGKQAQCWAHLSSTFSDCKKFSYFWENHRLLADVVDQHSLILLRSWCCKWLLFLSDLLICILWAELLCWIWHVAEN